MQILLLQQFKFSLLDPFLVLLTHSPILNIRDDNDFNFTYNEFDPFIYNPNSFDSNLISTIVFYMNVILGADADTFKKYGGEAYLKEAQNVMLQAQQSGIQVLGRMW